MFFYNKVLRSAFGIFYVLSLALIPFYGIQILTPYEAIISNLIGLVDGAILAVAYLTLIGSKFDESP